MEPDDQALPLTRGQLDILLAQETGRSGTEWQLGLFFRIEGTVERDALEQAIRQGVREAEPARAAFFEVDGRICQRAIDYSDVELAFYDLSGLDHAVQETRAIASSIQRTPMPFTGPLLKFALFRTRHDEFYMFACCHHIATDGLSMALVSRRVATIYSAIVAGAPIPPAFFGSLQDLIDCELEYEASTDYLEDQAYWSRNVPTENGLHYRLPQAANERDPCSPSAPVQLDPSVIGRIKGLSKSLGIRRFSVITAACALLVRGWCTGGSEVALDFPVSRRVRPESKTLPGMLAGVVPLVLTASPSSAVADFCEHVDTRIRELLQHQRFPVHVLEGDGGLRGPGQAANRVVVNFVPSRLTMSLAGAPATASYTTFGPVGHFGLNFLGAGDQLFLSTAGAGQPFSNFDVSDLAGRLEQVLVAMTADPRRSLLSMDLLDEAEHARLEGWGNRAVLTQPATASVSIPVLFAEQVARDPEAVAISCGECSWTYRQVEQAANRLAHLLAGHGAGPGQCVALLLSRSAEAIVAIMAVLKTGAAYLPIDPAHPDARIEFLLDDAAPIAAITTTGLRPRLDSHDVVIIDVNDPRIDSYPSAALPAPAPDDIAYLIYTSGTTGVPKGVAIPHHNVTRLLEALDAELELSPGQVWTQWHSLAFDFSVCEIWVRFYMVGGWWWCPSRWRAQRRRCTRYWSAEHVSVLSQTPSAFHALQTADALHPELAGQLKLRRVVFGGEALEPQRLGTWLDNHPGLPRLINMYGITETTVHASLREIVEGDADNTGQPDRGAVGPSWLLRAGWVVAGRAGGGGRGVVCGRCRGGVRLCG